jgi:ABC-type multidrug transport system fused ATPase/permease subunit
VISYFTGNALGYHFDPAENPAEFIINICGGLIAPMSVGHQNSQAIGDMPTNSVDSKPRSAVELQRLFSEFSSAKSSNSRPNGVHRDVSGGTWTDVSMHSATSIEGTVAVSSPVHPGDGNNSSGTEEIFIGRHATSKWTQFQMLMHRGWVTTTRNKPKLRTQVLKNLVVAGVVGIVFYGKANVSEPFFAVDENTGEVFLTADVTNLSSSLFFSMMYCLMANLDGIPALCEMNRLYRRELSAFAYCSSSYWVSTCLINVPIVFVGHAIFNTLAFFLCRFPLSVSYFAYFFCLLLLTNFSAFYFAQLLAASLGDAKVAFGVFPLPFIFLTMFAGYTIPVNNIPQGWKWASVVSYCRWAYEGLMANGFQRYDEGEDVLKYFDFDNYNKFKSFWVLLLVIVILLAFNYLAMRPSSSKLEYCELGVITTAKQKKSSQTENTYEDPFSESTLMDNLLSSCEADAAMTENEAMESIDAEKRFDEEAGNERSSSSLRRVNSTTSSDAFASPGCRLVFRNLHYTVPIASDSAFSSSSKCENKLRILNGVSGEAAPGEMVALMGASGAGAATYIIIL